LKLFKSFRALSLWIHEVHWAAESFVVSINSHNGLLTDIGLHFGR